MQAVQRGSIKKAAASLASSLADQDGVATAVNIIQQQLIEAAETFHQPADSRHEASSSQGGWNCQDAIRDVGYRHLVR